MNEYASISRGSHISVYEIMVLYNIANPSLIFLEEAPKIISCKYIYVVMKVDYDTLGNLFDTVHLTFDFNSKISYVNNGILRSRRNWIILYMAIPCFWRI